MRIQRDYMQVVGGVRLPKGQAMSKAQRALRANIYELLTEDHEVQDQNFMMTGDTEESTAKSEPQDDQHVKSSGGIEEVVVADTSKEDNAMDLDDDKENHIAKYHAGSSNEQGD